MDKGKVAIAVVAVGGVGLWWWLTHTCKGRAFLARILGRVEKPCCADCGDHAEKGDAGAMAGGDAGSFDLASSYRVLPFGFWPTDTNTTDAPTVNVTVSQQQYNNEPAPAPEAFASSAPAVADKPSSSFTPPVTRTAEPTRAIPPPAPAPYTPPPAPPPPPPPPPYRGELVPSRPEPATPTPPPSLRDPIILGSTRPPPVVVPPATPIVVKPPESPKQPRDPDAEKRAIDLAGKQAMDVANVVRDAFLPNGLPRAVDAYQVADKAASRTGVDRAKGAI